MSNHNQEAKQICGFTPAEALADLTVNTLDLYACRQWVLARIRPQGAVCNNCNSPIEHQWLAEKFMADARACCKGCGQWFTNRSGTIMQDSKLGWREVYLLAVLTGHGMKQAEIAKRVGVHIKTVSFWQKRFAILEEVSK